MTGPEHFLEAERLLGEAWSAQGQMRTDLLTAADTHSKLAQSAASVVRVSGGVQETANVTECSRCYGHRGGALMDDREDRPDLTAVKADDALLDELARGGYPNTEELAVILAGWRRAADNAPTREVVDVDTAQAAIRAGSRGRCRWFRQWMRNLIRWRWRS